MEWNVKLNSGWCESQLKYSSGKNLYLGKVSVASVFYDGTVSKGSVNFYALTTNMDGIKSSLGHYETEKEAMDKGDKVLDHWINKFLSHTES